MSELNNEINSNPLNASILIVDDESLNILLLTKILKTAGYKNIMSTSEPCEVMSLHNNNNFDLILLDINMPEMNGYEVLKKLHNSNGFKGTKVVATSADISSKDKKKASDAGFHDYITKPMKMNDLLEVVEKVLQENMQVYPR